MIDYWLNSCGKGIWKAPSSKTLLRMKLPLKAMIVMCRKEDVRYLQKGLKAPYKYQEKPYNQPNPEEKSCFITAVKFPAKRSSCPSQVQSCFHRALSESYFQNLSHVLFLANYTKNQTKD